MNGVAIKHDILQITKQLKNLSPESLDTLKLFVEFLKQKQEIHKKALIRKKKNDFLASLNFLASLKFLDITVNNIIVNRAD